MRQGERLLQSGDRMKTRHNLGQLEWTLAGWTPYVWRQQRSIESGLSLNAEVPGVPVCVPGSVQAALRDAGILPDWDLALNARLCEWVENRHWIYTTRLPDDWFSGGSTVRLRALGLDYCGWILLNGKEVTRFSGSLVPHEVDLTSLLREHENILQIVFDFPPRWLGQIGYTSQMREWKERFNYFWDWTSRLVQCGIWDDLFLDISSGPEIVAVRCTTSIADGRGTLDIHGELIAAGDAAIQVSLERDGAVIRSEIVPADDFSSGVRWDDLAVDLWWPNGYGDQPLYSLSYRCLDPHGNLLDEETRTVGFKDVRWEACEAAPDGADPWICVVNGSPVFLQGVNWTPVLPNFADVTDDHYLRLLQTYRDLGCTVLRVWGGAFLEKEIFYTLCDRLGLLVWQEFPLSSSGLDNEPPCQPDAIEEMAVIAESYIRRRGHHVSLLLWCGGNELEVPRSEERPGRDPVDTSHPMIARLAQIVAEHDPGRRFLPSSPSGPRFAGDAEEVGQGLHWDVHGPWHVAGRLDVEWTQYWEGDDALFRSEVGTAGASPVDIIRAFKGDLPEAPGTRDNPLWRRTSWWIDWPVFVEEHGREPESLEEYVAWSGERQARALSIAAAACKRRFPRCGGFIIWMGHDCFPCTANTAIVDFYGRLKPAGIAIRRVFRGA